MKVKKMKVEEGKRNMIDDFPNFDKTGSIEGMKKLYYGEDALLIRCGNYIYHVGNFKHSQNRNILTRGETLYFITLHNNQTN